MRKAVRIVAQLAEDAVCRDRWRYAGGHYGRNW
jgi:hypothetical protein